jgi:hypothetical protein
MSIGVGSTELCQNFCGLTFVDLTNILQVKGVAGLSNHDDN